VKPRPEIRIRGRILYDEGMAGHTSFKTGGPAEIFALPADREDLLTLVDLLHRRGLPYFLLGRGTNLLVSDRGIRGAVIDTAELQEWRSEPGRLYAGSGQDLSRLAWETGIRGWGGLEAFYALPGSLGGSLWMNARCYEVSLSEVLLSVDYYDPRQGWGEMNVLAGEEGGFGYKRSPFQDRPGTVILGAVIRLGEADPEALKQRMLDCEADRRAKGHFAAPSAGSVFKNSRALGKPSGKIIDELGLKGLRLGGAMVSPRHGNIIYNTGNASSGDIAALILKIKEEVYRSTGWTLEEEILYAGDWS
jgi:UDP-N-acetylmuramate dehydrogenase